MGDREEAMRDPWGAASERADAADRNRRSRRRRLAIAATALSLFAGGALWFATSREDPGPFRVEVHADCRGQLWADGDGLWRGVHLLDGREKASLGRRGVITRVDGGWQLDTPGADPVPVERVRLVASGCPG